MNAGLCGDCVHCRIVESRRGSRFYLCGLAATDPRFPKYPRLPVVRCAGFVSGSDGVGDRNGAAPGAD